MVVVYKCRRQGLFEGSFFKKFVCWEGASHDIQRGNLSSIR
jgi:hypothetical protein